ncbi:MAG: hypothetical protein IJU81_02630 [Bacteroidales bacterium]|nr:hypothetical protein [Bacteroidales bacterium]
MDYKEYLEQIEEMTREEVANKQLHQSILADMDRNRREMHASIDRKMTWDRRREVARYQDLQEEVRRRKSSLKMQYRLEHAEAGSLV